MKNNAVHPKRPPEIFQLFAATTSLSGVGAKLAAVLEKRVGSHVIDVLRHLPIGLTDRRQRPALSAVVDGSIATFEILVMKHDRPAHGVRRPYRVFCQNETGELELVFFHAHSDYIAKQLPVGARRIVSGRVDLFQGRVQMAHPDHIVAPENSDSMPLLEPIYPLTAGLTPKILRRTLTDALTRLPDLPEWIPEAILSTQKWPGFADAMRAVHAPQSEADLLPTSPARARLAFDELLANQLALIMVRQQAGDSAPGRSFTTSGKLVGALKDSLAFDMTAAQHRAISEITADQVAPKRMLRMLQGDVGSGKTLVALAAMLSVVESGAQAALLAPTEVLARQHHASLSALLQPLQIEVGLLLGQGRTSAQKPDASQQNQVEPPPTQRSRKATLAAMADGTLSLVVGTHALLSDTAVFKDLGVAVIDEQHRFGVRQRILLGEKGRNVDVMVMTATPIPRSLAMTAYGDLDHSQLDEKPVGRLPIDTRVIAGERLDDIVDGLRRALGDGKRAYWICPLVDESDQLDIAAAEARFASLSHALPGISVALAHGKMKAAERDSAMQDFRTGRAQLLVATTVVEVGVDVPEASIIVIEHAERFGLAQLHQLRGRVGRSSTQSSCLLVYYPPLSETASKRLSVMRETNDGFVIAEEDLSLRGPGEFLGQRQSGVPEFVLADLAVHRDLLAMARTEAHTMLAANASSDINLLLCLFERDSAVKFLAAG
ncbi:MAG: ATP-dependent DNA helicase RecG [Alphaproteobacteria bacterium]|nr:ATP-dependent DNA helicase RecG [Alphaproteobacteria bacterium]